MRQATIMLVAAAAALEGCDTRSNGTEGRPPGTEEMASGDAAETNSANDLQPVDSSDRQADASPAPDAAGGSQASDRMRWNFTSTAGPKLAYGEPQTDNVRLMLRCPRRREALLSFIRPSEQAEGRPATLTIASGGARRTVDIETDSGPLGTSVQAEAPLSAEPLQRFREGSDLEVRWGNETIRVPGRTDGPVRQFFDACG